MKRIILAAATLLLALLTAPASQADTTDNVYLADLERDGITVTDDALFIKFAHDACDQLNSGDLSLRHLVALASAEIPTVPSMTYNQGALIGDAIGAYCPEYSNQIRSGR